MGVLTEKVIKDEIMILIHILNDDVETQCIARCMDIINKIIKILFFLMSGVVFRLWDTSI